MRRPRIYGDEAACRRALARYIASADAVIDEAEGLRKSVSTRGSLGSICIFAWDRPQKWQSTVIGGLNKYLQGQLEDLLPLVSSGVPQRPKRTVADGERPTLAFDANESLRDIDDRVAWVAAARDELKELQAAVGVRRGIQVTPVTAGRFEELLASGLVDRDVIDDHARDMSEPHTPKQLAAAIGAAKELTEATLRAAITQTGETWKPDHELGRLMKTWREAMTKRAAPGSDGEDALNKALAGFATLIAFLAEWRNPYGDGHGRPAYPAGLRPRHARLAADIAETAIRFIVTTMDDLQILPPRPVATDVA